MKTKPTNRKGALKVLIAGGAFLASSSALAAPAPRFMGGVGFPELLWAEVGLWVAPRWSVDLHAGLPLFNVLVGAGTTGWLLGSPQGDLPPRHALIVSGHILVNPLLIHEGIVSGGESLRAALHPSVGYGFTHTSGFQAIVRAGAYLYLDDGPAVGPNLELGVGWTF